MRAATAELHKSPARLCHRTRPAQNLRGLTHPQATDPARHRVPSMSSLESWTLGSHLAGGISHPTYRKGSGPGVIVIHEIPGITPAVLQFGEDVVARGFTVVMPSLFGRAGSEATVLE